VALPAWWGDLDSGRPVVHVTQGTVTNRDYNDLIRPTIDGLAHDDVLVVVSTGGRPADTLTGPPPANVRVSSYLPYDELLPKTSVLVTNGGYGGLRSMPASPGRVLVSTCAPTVPSPTTSRRRCARRWRSPPTGSTRTVSAPQLRHRPALKRWWTW
jgi:hypothetical protein